MVESLAFSIGRKKREIESNSRLGKNSKDSAIFGQHHYPVLYPGLSPIFVSQFWRIGAGRGEGGTLCGESPFNKINHLTTYAGCLQKLCTMESTLMLLRVKKAAETLESGFRLVYLQPTMRVLSCAPKCQSLSHPAPGIRSRFFAPSPNTPPLSWCGLDPATAIPDT